METITYRYLNKEPDRLIFTDRFLFIEVIAFILCEYVMNKGWIDEESDMKIYDYIQSAMDPSEISMLEYVIDKVSLIVKELSLDPMFQNLINSTEVFVTYEYKFNSRITILSFTSYSFPTS